MSAHRTFAEFSDGTGSPSLSTFRMLIHCFKRWWVVIFVHGVYSGGKCWPQLPCPGLCLWLANTVRFAVADKFIFFFVADLAVPSLPTLVLSDLVALVYRRHRVVVLFPFFPSVNPTHRLNPSSGVDVVQFFGMLFVVVFSIETSTIRVLA